MICSAPASGNSARFRQAIKSNLSEIARQQDMWNDHNTIAVSAMRFQILNTSFLVLNMKTHVSYEARHYKNIRHRFLSRI
jgi:hypothetical protein